MAKNHGFRLQFSFNQSNESNAETGGGHKKPRLVWTAAVFWAWYHTALTSDRVSSVETDA